MSNRSPLLSPESYLTQIMRNQNEVSLEAFLRLWNSSAALRILISNIIRNGNIQDKIGWDTNRINVAVNPDQGAKSRNGSSMDFPFLHNEFSTEAVKNNSTLSYGGLSRKALLLLLEKHKGGKRNLGAYMLIRGWKKMCTNPTRSPDVRIEQFTLNCFRRAIKNNREDFFCELADSIRFLKDQEYHVNGNWSHDPVNWWQFHLLLYILEYPKELYAMREFVQYFRDEVGENEMPTTKTIRRFCRTYGIALDSRPGAPKKSKIR